MSAAGEERGDCGGEAPCMAHLGPLDDLGSRTQVYQLVRRFYRRCVQDELLGPIFDTQVADWDHHFDVITEFWMWQLFGERGYHGQTLDAHRHVHEAMPLGTEHFGRWVELFCETVDELAVGPVAETAKQRGRKMAAAMERLLSGVHARGSEDIGVYLTTAPPSAS